MDILRVRNITTGFLHTEMAHVYEDLHWLMGHVLMTHMLPRAARAVTPYLKSVIVDPRFWDNQFDITHLGEVHVPKPKPIDQVEMMRLYDEQPDPLERFYV